MDLKTGKIKSKKAPKQKSPDQEAFQELKKVQKKPLD